MADDITKYENIDLSKLTIDELKALAIETDFLKKKYHSIQNSKKVAINSVYGLMGNEFFRYSNHRMASAVTMTGQLSIRYIIEKLSENFPSMIALASDTDSCYFEVENDVRAAIKENNLQTNDEICDFVDKYCDTVIEPKIDETFQHLADYLGAPQCVLKMKREKIAVSGIWKAKKKYALLTLDSEKARYAHPKLEVTGLQIIQASTPKPAREELRSLVVSLLTDKEQFTKNFYAAKEKFIKLPPEEMAFPTSVNNIIKYSDPNNLYAKGCPMHVRAALVYNKYIQDNGIESEYPMILEGDRIKFLFLKVPNPFFNENVIAFAKRIPHREKVIEYLDLESQYYRAIEKIILDIAASGGVKISDSLSLNDMF